MGLTKAGLDWISRNFRRVIKIGVCLNCEKTTGINVFGYCKECWDYMRLEGF